jgi:hypothetical protein
MKDRVLDRIVLAITLVNVVLLVHLLHVVVSALFCTSTFRKYSRRVLLAIHSCTSNLQQFNSYNFRFLQRCILESDCCGLLRDDMWLKFTDVAGSLVGLIMWDQ